VFTAADWNQAHTVTVTGVDDGALDGDVPFTVVLDPAFSTDPAYLLLDPDDVDGTNLDDDSAGGPGDTGDVDDTDLGPGPGDTGGDGTSVEPKEPEGCDCATGSPSGLGAGLLLVLAAVARRRRWATAAVASCASSPIWA